MLKEKLLEDLKEAMKDKNLVRKNTIQMIRAAILQVEKDKQIELTEEQVNSLCSLYDRQIANLRKSNEMRKQKLLEYRRKLQTEN